MGCSSVETFSPNYHLVPYQLKRDSRGVHILWLCFRITCCVHVRLPRRRPFHAAVTVLGEWGISWHSTITPRGCIQHHLNMCLQDTSVKLPHLLNIRFSPIRTRSAPPKVKIREHTLISSWRDLSNNNRCFADPFLAQTNILFWLRGVFSTRVNL